MLPLSHGQKKDQKKGKAKTTILFSVWGGHKERKRFWSRLVWSLSLHSLLRDLLAHLFPLQNGPRGVPRDSNKSLQVGVSSCVKFYWLLCCKFQRVKPKKPKRVTQAMAEFPLLAGANMVPVRFSQASSRGKVATYHVSGSCESQGYGRNLSQILPSHRKVTWKWAEASCKALNDFVC